MFTQKTVIRTASAAIAFAGLCGIAAAQTPQTHVLTVTLPTGAVEQVRYSGNTPPHVTVSDTPMPAFVALPALFGAGSPFVEMERISAAMDRRAAQMLQEAAALSARPGAGPTAVGALPAGTREYSFVSTMTGSGVCSRSIEITSQGNGAAPRLVTHTSGDCGPAGGQTTGGQAVPTKVPTMPIPANGPQMIMTSATGAQPHAGRLEEAALR